MSSTKVLSPSDSSMPINGSGPVLRKWLWKTSYPFAVLYQTTWVGLKEEEKKNSWHTKIQSPAYLQLAEFFLSEMSGLDNNQSSGEENLSLYGKFLFRDKICVLKIIYADINNKEKKSRKCALKGKCKWFVIPWYAMMFCKKLRIFLVMFILEARLCLLWDLLLMWLPFSFPTSILGLYIIEGVWICWGSAPSSRDM